MKKSLYLFKMLLNVFVRAPLRLGQPPTWTKNDSVYQMICVLQLQQSQLTRNPNQYSIKETKP